MIVQRRDFKNFINHPGTVCGICLTVNNKFILINTKRFNNDEYLEIPGGILEIDNPKKEIEREVYEEIGYVVTNSKLLKVFNTSVGITNEVVYLYFCDVRKTEITPEFETIEISFKEFSNLVNNGNIKDSKTLLAYEILKNKVDMENTTYSKIVSIWAIQDSLLQMYRSIFLTCQSVIFSITAIMVSQSKPAIFTVSLSALGIYLLWTMYRLNLKRSYAISYCQLHLIKLEKKQEFNHDHFFIEFNDFLQNKIQGMQDKLKKENIAAANFKHYTKKKIEMLSVVFLLLWIAVIIFVLFK